METAAISYRVADFLKKYPPFQAMEDADLLALAGHGRVRFHERHEHILSQGETHKHFIFVIQQGVVSLWDDVNGAFELRDVRGAGDLLGVERFNGAPVSMYSARAATDVVIYAFPFEHVAALLDAYPDAKQFVSTYSAVTLDYDAADERRRPEDVFLHDVVKAKRLVTCGLQDTIRAAAQSMREHGVDTLAVVDVDRRPCGVLTSADLLAWIAEGHLNADHPVETILKGAPVALSADASVVDGVLTMGVAGAAAVAITADGTTGGELHALVTAADLASVFGDQPVSILREVHRASSTSELRALNHRARAFALEYLTSARSVDWLTRFTALVDQAIVNRVIGQAGAHEPEGSCWAFCGSSGRGESLTRAMPELIVISDSPRTDATAAYQRVVELLGECDYLPRAHGRFDPSFYTATIDEWKERYLGWLANPILNQMHEARELFDVRPIHGLHSLWHEIETDIAGAVDRDFLQIIANDCVARMPPLTFFQDAVVDDMGERSEVFQLDRTALTPLVVVARVYGIAAGRVVGGSTHERFALARRLLPRHQAMFREAADTFSIVLWQQGRIGIRQGTSGAELPPSLLSRHDRQVLKSGFRVILQLIELTASWEWLDAL
jgi:CBS domain-containing protein